MKWIFGLLGLMLGGAMGGFETAIMGALLGVAVAFGLQSKSKPDAGATADSNTENTFLNSALHDRLSHIEREVAQLRAEVRRLQQADGAAGRSPASSPEQASQAAKAPVAPAPEPNVTSAALQATPPPALVVKAPPTLPPTPAPQSTPKPEDFPWEDLAAQATKPKPASSSAPTPNPARRPAAPAPVPLRDRLPPWVSQLVFGGNSIVKVGVLILFLGLAFLLRYAAERVTTPPELRYAAVALLGAALLALGWRLRERRDAAGGSGYGLILQGAGIGVLYLTTLAAMKLGQLLPPELAFAFLFAVTLLSAVLAVAQGAPWLAYVAAAEGFAAPVLVSTGSGNLVALFSYLSVLNLGIFAVAWFKAWRPLNLIGAVGTFTLASAWASRHYAEVHYPVTQGFLLFFFLLFTLIGVLFARRALALGDAPDERLSLSERAAHTLAGVGRVDSTLVFGIPLASFGLQYLMVRDWSFGPAWSALGFAAVYLLLGGALIRGGQRRFALLGEAYVIISVIFVTLAVPLALEGEWTGATWAIEAAGMYWLGLRQRRPYARAFALLVLSAAVVRVFSALGVDATPHTPLLQGSVLGLLMLAGGAAVLSALTRRLPADDQRAWDTPGGQMAMWVSGAAVAAVAWVLLVPQWASVAMAALGLTVALLRQRWPLPTLGALSAALHATALAGMANTLHRVEGGDQLDGSRLGGLAALLIALGLLGSLALPVRAALARAKAQRGRPEWSLGSSLGWIAGFGLLGMSLLFSLPAAEAARAWPWLGVAALALGLRLWQPGLVLAWAALQAASALAQLAFGAPFWAPEQAGPGVWTALSLALASLLSGHWLRRAADAPWAWHGLQSPLLAWGQVSWMWLWWFAALLPTVQRAVLQHSGSLQLWPAALVLGLLLSSALGAGLARACQWAVLGQSTAFTLPALAGVAALHIGLSDRLPSANGGWLAWSLALLWHGLLLRFQPRWLPERVLAALHVLGLWLFLLLAAREGQAALATLGAPDSAWPLLGWALAPALLLFALSRPALAQRWPLNAFGASYLRTACAPIAAYLLLWLWAANTQAGSAAPLPYVPLLNPLELGQGLVLLALLLWWRAAYGPDESAGSAESGLAAQLPRPLRLGLMGATAFALMTGAVLRACHHLAGVDWSEDALFASTLTQAALSVTWALSGVLLMVTGHRRVQRVVWLVGAALLAVVVLKLFLVELADTGGLYRIVSFIVVGLLLLVVGYFAPVPPAENSKEAADVRA